MPGALITMAALLLLFPPLILYLSVLERKVLADMQARLGPMRVGPHGLLQGMADAIKLLLKEDVIPSGADPVIFRIAPIAATAAALTALAVIPFSSAIHVSDVNVGLLVIIATASFGILGLVLGGWASNSHYPLLGAIRSAAQLVSYEIALAFALLCGLMSAGTLSLVGVVEEQRRRHIWFVFDHWGFMLLAFVIFVIAAIAEANRAPFDLPEAESELAGGYHLEYSGMRWAFFMLSEYGNLFVACAAAVTLFWGGWLQPFPSVAWLEWPVGVGVPLALFLLIAGGCFYLARESAPRGFRLILWAIGTACIVAAAGFAVPALNHAAGGIFWFLLKVLLLLYVMIWLRATFPRLRYDQLMRLGWKWLIPAGFAAVLGNALLGVL